MNTCENTYEIEQSKTQDQENFSFISHIYYSIENHNCNCEEILFKIKIGEYMLVSPLSLKCMSIIYV